ncbi:hypothetical protein AB4865_02040 [Capnocytophaga sp. ARDL2]|uniref:hypothetical protein n=1 Tax=Capnocytophaga sp. ARDL2 TaxID=3238809 RepID=UPI0035573CD2
MKHWIEFLPKKSYKTKRLGKIIQTYEYEILEAQAKVKMYQEAKSQAEKQIFETIREHYTTHEEMIYSVTQAQEHAEKWNSEPISNHKPHTLKEQQTQ